MTYKQQTRDHATTAIASLSGELRIVLDAQIATHITHLPSWREATTVFGYIAMEDEVDLHAVFQSAYRSGKRIALPRIDNGALSFRLVGRAAFEPGTDEAGSELETHPFGFRQPRESASPATPDESTLILVPGRAFDRGGARLGRGGAFYDRFLSGLDPRVVTVGVAYSVQVLRSVPHDDTDVPVQIVLSDSETCFCRRSA